MAKDHVLSIELILMIAAVVAMLCQRLRLPYSVGLVAAGIVLAFVPHEESLPLSRDLLFTVFLPPLVFEAALQLHWKEFRRNLPVTLLLAFPGVVIASAVVALGVHFALGWGWMAAAMFGVLISATDPVAVIAAFKELKVQPRLALLVESESLMNDGTAAVGFAILATIAQGMSTTPTGVTGQLLWMVLGGVTVGGLLAGALLLLAGRTNDHLVEITLTVLTAYGSFILAEHFAMSGVLATLAAGMVVGNFGWSGAISPNGRGHVRDFWIFVAFLVNSVVFILIGTSEAHQPLALYAAAAAMAIVLVLVGRALAIYPLCGLLERSSLRVPLGYQHVLFWGGLRGALALALALGLPASLPERNEVVATAFAVVAFSIFAQGLTMPWLIARLGLSDRRAGRAEGPKS